MDKTFAEAMDFRHACKIFDESKKIKDEDLNFILEAARKSPSSFGMEPWKFLIITNEKLKEQLKPLCWNQVQITSCSHLIIILAAIDDLRPEFKVVERKFKRRNLSEEKTQMYIEVYANHLKDILSSDEKLFSWTARQTYLAMANMMTAAAVKGIDSCPIEGFEKQKIEELLKLDTKKYQISCFLPLGYRVNAQSKQLREDLKDIVEYIN